MLLWFICFHSCLYVFIIWICHRIFIFFLVFHFFTIRSNIVLNILVNIFLHIWTWVHLGWNCCSRGCAKSLALLGITKLVSKLVVPPYSTTSTVSFHCSMSSPPRGLASVSIPHLQSWQCRRVPMFLNSVTIEYYQFFIFANFIGQRKKLFVDDI